MDHPASLGGRQRSFSSKWFSRKVEMWALKQVNFEVFRGEALVTLGIMELEKAHWLSCYRALQFQPRGRYL